MNFKVIFIEKVLNPKIVRKDLKFAEDVPLLHIEAIIDKDPVEITGDKKALLKLANIIKTHFENHKLL